MLAYVCGVYDRERFSFDTTVPDAEILDDGALIFIYAKEIRPLNSTCEQYSYFDFPFCPRGRGGRRAKRKSFEDVISGDCYTTTEYKLRFKKNTTRQVLCEKSLTKPEVAKFRDAVKRKFVYHLAYPKGLLLKEVGRIEDGEEEEEQKPKYYLATDVKFYIKYHKNQVTSVVSTGSVPSSDVDITRVSKMNITFTYSVTWEETAIPSAAMPMPVPLKEKEVPEKFNGSRKVNWVYSVLIWVTTLSLTLPYFWIYFTRYWEKKKYSAAEIIGSWSIHGENCNCPLYTSLLGAMLGNGVQLVITVCIFLVLAFYGMLHTCDLESLSFEISRVHCCLSVVAGYIATSFHTRFTQVGWKECIFQTTTIYALPVLITALLANHLAATTYGLLVLDRSIILRNMVIWGIPSVASAGLGGIFAKKFGRKSQPPCDSTRFLREIPKVPWYMKTLTQIVFTVLVTSALMVFHMAQVFASLCKLKTCNTLESLVTALFAAVFVTALNAVSFTKFQMVTNHGHQWWWRSFLCGGSPAIFMFGYGVYFFSRVESDQGSLVRIFGYNACISYACFLILGTISFYVSSYTRTRYNIRKLE